MAISAAMVKDLRERTGLGMMDCKRALQDADGDIEKAIEELRKSSSLKAAKKAGRTAANGLLGVMVSEDCSRGAIVEVNIETDFAAKNEKFIDFVSKVTETVFEASKSGGVEEAPTELEALRESLIQEIGENIMIRRIKTINSKNSGLGYYVHGDQRRGAIVELTAPNTELARDLAMHVVATAPMVARPEDLSQEVLDKEREIYVSQAEESGKPADIVEKMVEGRIRKYVAEVSLLEQDFVKDPDKKVKDLLKSAEVDLVSFVRFEVGEGIEVEEEDFASEVAAQIAASDQD